MRRLLVVVAVVLASGLVSGRVARADKDADLTRRVLASLHSGAECQNKSSPWRVWCIAADGWAKARPAPLPKGKALVGLTIELIDGGDTVGALRDAVSLSALAFKVDGKATFAKITQIKPTSRDEEKSVLAAVGGVTMVLKGKARGAKLPADLLAYVGGLGADATYAVARAPKGWTWKGASVAELRKVGTAWVAIEIPDKHNGLFVTVFTDKLK